MKNLKTTFLFSILALSACAPKVQEKNKQAAYVANGPKTFDVNLTAKNKNVFADSAFAKENLDKNQDSKNLIKQSEAFFDISTFALKKDWQKKATAQFEKTQSALKTKKISADSSIYLDLVYGSIQADVGNSIDKVNSKITADSEKILATVRDQQAAVLKSMTLESSLKEKLDRADQFLLGTSVKIKAMDLQPEFKELFIQQLQVESRQLLTDGKAFEEQLSNAKVLSAGLNLVNEFLKKANIQLPEQDQKNLATGVQLSTVVDTMEDKPKRALQALAIIWSLLDEAKRIEHFQGADKKLYEFFAEKSESDLQCLMDTECVGSKNKLTLNLGVYPALEEFGVVKIHDLINSEGLKYLSNKINLAAHEAILKIGETVSEKVLAGVQQKKSDLIGLKNNFRSYLSTGFSTMMKAKQVTSLDQFVVDANGANLDFETQTAYLRTKLKSLPLQTNSAQLIKNQFELVETVLNLPLYSKSLENSNKPVKTDLLQILMAPEARAYMSSVGSTENTISLSQQAELLLTMSSYVRELADWKATTFDKNLSAISASQVLAEFQTKNTDRPFFSKSDLLPLVVSISSHTLRLLQSAYSPILLITPNNDLIPLSTYLDGPGGPVTLAAATDLSNVKRSDIVKTSDLVKFQKSLIQFYSATQALEQTKAALLTTVDKKGATVLNEFAAARKNIRLLIVAIGNFISNRLVQPSGLVTKQLSLNDKDTSALSFDLVDQTAAIEALVKTYEMTDIDVYLWSALDMYYAMNSKMFSETRRFYKNNLADQMNKNVDYTTALETYKNLLNLKPYMAKESQIQFEQIFEGWTN